MDWWAAAALAAPSAVAFAVVYALTPPLIRWLAGRGMTVGDYHKPGRPQVARPGGISLMAGVAAAELALYAAAPSPGVLAVLSVTAAAFAVGLVDDLRVMGGWFKPVALAAAGLPLLALGAYDHSLAFPLFGEVRIPVLYLAVALVTVSLTGNTINSIDVLNGVASGFMAIAGAALTASLVIVGNHAMAAASLPMVATALAFYRYHRLPSRVFPGDSGALLWGGMYGAVAIAGGVEVVAAVALLPAVVNSFLFLSSMKRIVEHRKIGARPVEVAPDGRLRATRERRAPVTLVRLILAGGPLTEAQVARAILSLAAFSGALAVATAFLMGGPA